MRYFVKLGASEVVTMPRGVVVKCAGNYFDTEDEALEFIKERDEK